MTANREGFKARLLQCIHWMSKSEKEWFIASTPINWICQYEPLQAIRKGWNFSLPEGDISIDHLIDYQEALNLKQEVAQLFIMANQYGSAFILINVEDGQPCDRPLDIDNVRSVKSFSSLHCYQLRGNFYAENPLKPDFYELIGGFHATQSTIIHPSRVIRADGISISADLMMQNGGCSLSYPEFIGPAYVDWLYGSDLLINALEQHGQFVYRREGLIEALEDDILGNANEEELRKRLEFLEENKVSHNGLAIDKEREEIGYNPFPLQGLNNIPNHFKAEFQMRSNIPHNALWGEGASGNLGAVGSLEKSDIINAITAFQEYKLAPVLDRIYNLIFLSKDGPSRGTIPPAWTYEFNSLIEETEAEKREKANSIIQQLKTAQEMGWISPMEARETLKHLGTDISFSDEEFYRANQNQNGYGQLYPAVEKFPEFSSSRTGYQ